MKDLRRITHSLTFRITAPVITVVLLAGLGLYIFVLRFVSDFTGKAIKKDMLEMSREIYNICDRSLNELLMKGVADDEKAVRIKKGIAIGMIEDFIRQHNISGTIIEGGEKTLSASSIPPEILRAIEKNIKQNTISPVEHGGNKYYVYQMDFNPWNWSILFISDAAEYSFLIKKVKLAYIATGAILSVTVFLLLCYLNKAIKHPINKIINPIKKGDQPGYKGIYEFEFLSDSINEMMSQKQSLMRQIIEEQKLKGIRVLASGVAHNFNNMLVGVLGYASLVRMKLEEARMANQPIQGELSDELIKHMSTIESSAQKAGGLARELTNLSRKRVLEKDSIASIDINKLISELHRLLSGTFPKNIEITTSLFEGLPVIKGDISQLDQALLNICINSKDAMPDGGRLDIRTSITNITKGNVKYHYLKPGNYVTIQLSDTGIGMDENILTHIFEPFFTTKPVDKGTGLGLATVYSIIKAHQGYITAESASNSGSTFTIYLPIE